MLGVMALAVVVLGVVIFFWMWCFPGGAASRESVSDYRLVLSEGFKGDSVQLQMNDSVVFSRMVACDSLEVSVKFPEEACFLMVARPLSDRVSSFELPVGGATVLLRDRNGKVEMELRK